MRRPRLQRLGAVLVSTLLTLALAEVALRLLGVSHPNFYQPHPVRGWALIPGAEGRWRSEGDAYVRVNRDGWRDEERALAKPAATVRIAVLGDSCTEAVQVAAERTFVKLLETELRSCPALAGRRAEALNFGVSGYGTAQELLVLREAVWKYHPDVVLLGFYAGNDIRNNYRPLDLDPARAYLELRGEPTTANETLVLDDSFRSTAGYRIRQTLPARLLYGAFNHSRVLQLGKQGETVVKHLVGSARASQNAAGALQELGLDNAVYAPPADANWQSAWRVTEVLLHTMRDESAAHGARFGVVALTTPMQVHPDPAVRADFASKLGVSDLFYPDDRLADWSATQGIPFLSLARPLRELAEREHAFLHGFPNSRLGEGHWNERGHAAAAQRIAPWLCGWLAPAGQP